MTKDELNGILKEVGIHLAPLCDGTFNDFFYVLKESHVVVEFNGVNFIFYRDYRKKYGKKIVAALTEYVNTPIAERKPKPQFYNIILAQDTPHGSHYLTAWRKVNKLGEYSVIDAARQYELLHNDDFKFTVEEIEDLKSKVSEKQKQIIDIGMVKVEETMSARVDTTND